MKIFPSKPNIVEVGPQGPLNEADEQEFEKLKIEYVAIEKQAWHRKAEILIKIRNERFYRSTHVTFESFCKDVFDLTKQRAYQLMASIKTAEIAEKALAGANVKHVLQSPELKQRHIMELHKVPSDKLPEAAAKLAGKEKITQKDVEQAVKETRQEAKKKGQAPAEIVELVAKGESVIRACKSILAALIWPGVQQFEAAIKELAAGAPYSDCFYCGKVAAKCVACEGRGWLPQGSYDNADKKNQEKAKAKSKVSIK